MEKKPEVLVMPELDEQGEPLVLEAKSIPTHVPNEQAEPFIKEDRARCAMRSSTRLLNLVMPLA